MHRPMSLALAVVALGTLAGAQGQDRPDLQLKAAVYKETVEGDLQGAIALYKQVVSNTAAARPIAAAALLGLGGCYEKLGDAQAREARRVYERLVAEYGDQAQEVASARTRLAALAKNAEPQKPTFRKIRIPSKRSNYGKLSPDGQTLAYAEGGSLWTVPVHGKSDPNIAGAPTRLTEPLHTSDSGNICVEWSADGRWIGCLAEVPQLDKPSVAGLYVVPAAGGTPRRVPITWEKWAGGAYSLRYALSAGAETLYFAAGKELDDLRIYSMPTGGGERRPLTPPITREPALSPDGSRIAYLKGEKGQFDQVITKEVWVASADGTGAQLAYRLRDEALGTSVGGPIWSPDGKMLAFLTRMPSRAYTRVLVLRAPDGGGPAPEPASFDLPVGQEGTPDLLAGWTKDNRIGVLIPTEERTAIYTIAARGGRAVQLTPKAGFLPAWTPDSTRIYFWGTHVGDGAGFEVIPAEGGAVQRLSLDGEYGRLKPSYPPGGSSISPDGQSICVHGFAGATRDGTRPRIDPGIFILSTRGGRPTRLTTGDDFEPKWSPDGGGIAFIRLGPAAVATRQRPANIVLIPRGGGEPRQVTTDGDSVAIGGLAWSPDGREIAFFARDNALRVVPVGGGASRILTKVSGDLMFCGLAWSPDGEMIAYVSGGALWRIPATGGTPTSIETGLDAQLEKIAWSPDGKTIAFGATSGGEHEFWLMEDFVRFVKNPEKR